MHRRAWGGTAPPLRLEALSELPLIDKEVLHRSQRAHPPFGDYLAAPAAKIARIHRTSGTVEGAMHIVRYVNPAFCRLIDRTRDELVGTPFREILPEKDECLALLDRVYRTGTSESRLEQVHPDHRPLFSSLVMWPVMSDDRTVGVMIQVIETTPLYEKALAMSEALMVGALHQHELTALAERSNTKLQTEVVDRAQRERDAKMLTREVSHRIKNNLQIVVALIAYEARSTPASSFKP